MVVLSALTNVGRLLLFNIVNKDIAHYTMVRALGNDASSMDTTITQKILALHNAVGM